MRSRSASLILFALAASSCGKNRSTETPTMIPAASQADPTGSLVPIGSCARLALCCRSIYASSSTNSSSAQTTCSSLATLANGGSGSEASCATALAQVTSIASLTGTLPPECRGPEAATMGSLGALTVPRYSVGRGTTFSVPSTINGTLTTGDQVDTDGALYDEYRVFLSSGAAITLVARGGANRTTPGSTLDMYLVLRQNGVEVTHDDDSAGSLNSRIVFTPVTSGWYQVRVRPIGTGVKEGDYTLQAYSGELPTAT